MRSLPRPTRIESIVAALLLTLSVLELAGSDVASSHLPVAVLGAVVPPVLVAFGRGFPVVATGLLSVVWVVQALEGATSATFGAGMSMLVIALSLAAWGRGVWPWALLLVTTDSLRTSRMPGSDASDVVVDWAFLGMAFAAGALVHRRSVHAEAMDARLHLAESSRQRETADAIARERALLARELHDIVAHAVSVMVVQAGTARPRAERVDAELAAVLGTVEQSGRQALTELRRLLGVLRADDSRGLEPTPDLDRLPELVEQVRAAGLDARLSVSVVSDVAPGVALCAYRVVQEGLTNALRHAAGSKVAVRLVQSGARLTVSIADDGGRQTAAGLGSGNGLAGLRERVLLCGGRMTAGPSGGGFVLAVELPLDAAGVLT